MTAGLRGLALVLLAACLACSSDRPTPAPTSPSVVTPPPGPAVRSLVLDASSIGRGASAALVVGASHQMRARGSTVQGLIDVEALWHSDNPAVLSTTPQGRLTGVSNGWAKLVATYNTLSDTMDVHVATDYAGDWPGALRLIRCESPDPAFCARRFPPLALRALQLSVIMDHDTAVTRFRWDLDGSTVSLTEFPEVGLDGSLVFAGRFYDARGFEVPLVTAGWRSVLVAPDRMAGRVTLIHGLRDAARTEWELADVRRAPR